MFWALLSEWLTPAFLAVYILDISDLVSGDCYVGKWIMSYCYPESAYYILRFIDHLIVMFGETPAWDLEQKYCPDNLEVREILFGSSVAAVTNLLEPADHWVVTAALWDVLRGKQGFIAPVF